MHEAFIKRNFSEGSLAIIEMANVIIAEYKKQRFSLTLRQLYYQFVARDLIANKQTEYKRLGSIINDARLAGLVDWDAIEDRTRNVRPSVFWESPSSIVAAVAQQYKEDIWCDQTYRPEVWIEKDALVGVIEPVCQRLRVPYFACRGYSSQSEQYAAGKRFAEHIENGQKPIILHLGDHDPSGIDMTRDNESRVSMFAGEDIEVRRLALNWDQIQRYNPPPNPAKETDSRSAGYKEQYGNSSWELDALDPRVIQQLVRDEIEGLIDQAEWDGAKEAEQTSKDLLQATSDRWEEVVDFLEKEEE